MVKYNIYGIGDNMKKSKIFILFCFLLILLAGFTGCAKGKSINLKNAKPYVEADFVKEIARIKDNGFNLAIDSVPKIAVIYPVQISAEVLEAIKDMQSILSEIIGAKIDFQPDNIDDSGYEISLGKTNRLTKNAKNFFKDIENDGYGIFYELDKMFIYSDTDSGIINAIYGFLEDSLGCMWLTADESYLPPLPTINLERHNEIYNPDIIWRSVYGYEQMNSKQWVNRLKLNGVDVTPDGREKHKGWGTWCHTMFNFLSPDEYFDEHPEYFSEVDGVRVKKQLCLTNENVYQIVKNNMAAKINANPEYKYWDFSIMDVYGGCECANCAELDKAEGSGMGSLLPFVNRLATEFPSKIISTLAYFHTVEPPRNLKPLDNVIIKLCAMPGDQASPYSIGKTNGSKNFKQQVHNWSAISNNLFIWDYTTNFNHLLLPFPNFAVQQPNTQFYMQNNVYGVFHQSSREYGGEMAEMRAYIMAKLMWDSDVDVNSLMSKYLSVYYGSEVGKEIILIMQRMHDALYTSGRPLGLYDDPSWHNFGYLSETNVDYYFKQYEKAVKKSGGNNAVMKKLEKYKIPLLYAKMYQSGFGFKEKTAAADEFFGLLEKYEITSVTEIATPIEVIKQNFENELRNRKNLLGIIIGCVTVLGIIIIVVTIAILRHIKKKDFI